jgi:moderate conductance mechanosensitive channel
MPAEDHGYIYDLLIKLGLSDFGARTGEFLLVRPLKILLILVVAIVVGRIAGRAIRRFLRAARLRNPLRSESARAEQRITTIGDVLVGLVRALIGTVAVFLVLDQLGLNLAPLIAGAGIAGIAIGFGAQSMVKDFLAGLFILVEDQYGVGDVVNVGEATGTIEDITLRVTRLRAVDGTVWFVPNGEIKSVGNTSMEWSRALIDVIVPYDVDVAKASAAIGEEASALAADPDWRDQVLEEPEVWGVQEMGKDGLTIRMVMKTAPRQQYAIARELRGRISARLRREGIKAPGQTVLVTSGALDQGAPPIPPPPDEE